MKIDVIGAGPAGLYLSMLVKKRQPNWSVTVYEQNAPNASFGFGVVVADAGLARLRQVDAASHDALVSNMRFTNTQTIVQKEQAIDLRQDSPSGGAIKRLDLLRVLGDAALAAGVSVHYGQRINDFAALDADLLVGADGVNSALRNANEAAFGTTRSLLTNHFAWFGTSRVFDNPALVFRRFEHAGHVGYAVAHYYPYCDNMSTFVAECDHGTWLRMGLETASDWQRQALFEVVFAPELAGHTLQANNNTLNTVWRQFPVVRNVQWTSGNQVLLGDAQSSAHFSIGSGTRIAMEDAAALAQALLTHSKSVQDALTSFVQTRKPFKDRLIAASQLSYEWYECMERHMEALSPHAFVHSYMTRTGRVDNAKLALQFPEFMAQWAYEQRIKILTI